MTSNPLFFWLLGWDMNLHFLGYDKYQSMGIKVSYPISRSQGYTPVFQGPYPRSVYYYP